jgi:imidazolonepropionase-like amidohydrolase
MCLRTFLAALALLLNTRIVLQHVEIIDGTGAAPLVDRNLTIEDGKITAITAGADEPPADGTNVLDLRGYSVMPGIVGMHDHLDALSQFTKPTFFLEMPYSAPRLYLANGVTTIRTTGSIEPYTDVRLKQAIDSGKMPGPHMDVTGPYLEGITPNGSLAMYQLTSADDARQTVAYWADRGVTSFKAYKDITRDELGAAIAEAHKRGLKVTGHLCSVTYPEAIALGIDNLEHGFAVNTTLDPDKKPDLCSASNGDYTLEHTVAGTPEADELIRLLVSHHVAITSTLVSAAAYQRPSLPPAVLEAMAPTTRDGYVYWRNRPVASPEKAALLLKREMDLERAFVAAGGLLMAGPDPVGIGGNLPGFGDHREIELLVDAGFTPLQAIRIATLNGAIFLGRDKEIGSIAIGRNADILVTKGDPASRINDIENVEIVFKDGVRYDTKKLLESVKGHYGEN